MNKDAIFLIEKLKLTAHPEGGFFSEVHRSGEIIRHEHLPARYKSDKVFSTSIYYLLEGNNVSHFHRLMSDEIWHFYCGSTLIIHSLNNNSGYQQTKIGSVFSDNINPQFTIQKGLWFAAEIEDKNSYALIGCTVAPGFEYTDFELANKELLLEQFPSYKEIINRLTKE